MTIAQKNLARHALGLSSKRRTSYRNRYYGTDVYWDDMVSKGWAQSKPWGETDRMYFLTRAGAKLALEPGEKLDTEDFPA